MSSVRCSPLGALGLGAFRTRRRWTMKANSQRKSVVRCLLGLAAVLVIDGHARDAGAASVCNATNEVVFTPSTPIVIAGGVTNFCHLAFDLVVVNPEPTSGPQSDATPLVIEEVDGFVQAAAFANGDATCNNNLQAGNQGSAAIPLCPPCVSDECTDRTCPDDTTNPNAGRACRRTRSRPTARPARTATATPARRQAATARACATRTT